VPSGNVPYYLAIFAVGNLFGPLVLGRLFDTVGRKPMISGTYLLSGVLLIITALLFRAHDLTAATLVVGLTITFFFASAGVSAAYLTVSEIFPLETRALCISVFYAVGTALGGITGPLLFSALITTGDINKAALAFIIGAVMMIIGGLVELVYGIKAEGRGLEDIAAPLTAEDHRGAPPRTPAAATSI
jgi:MFS family permease